MKIVECVPWEWRNLLHFRNDLGSAQMNARFENLYMNGDSFKPAFFCFSDGLIFQINICRYKSVLHRIAVVL